MATIISAMIRKSAKPFGTRWAAIANAWFVMLGVALPFVVGAQPSRPLLLEGKQALYQRVIAIPGATVVAAAGAAVDGAARPVTPFTVFYVYARQQASGREWIQVGRDSDGRTDGWLPAEQAVDWKQTLTVGFKDPAKQPRVLLFGEREPLRELVERNDADRYATLRMQAIAGEPVDSPVAAVQPDGFIDIRHNFYLVPILSHEDVLVADRPARLLQVASVPLRSSAAQDPYRAGIVFVIDTTRSMQPFIERTRETCAMSTSRSTRPDSRIACPIGSSGSATALRPFRRSIMSRASSRTSQAAASSSCTRWQVCAQRVPRVKGSMKTHMRVSFVRSTASTGPASSRVTSS